LHSIVDDDDGSDDYVDWPGDGSNDGTGPPWWADVHDWLALFLSPTACVAYVALALVGVAVAAYRYRYGISLLLGFGTFIADLVCDLVMPPSYKYFLFLQVFEGPFDRQRQRLPHRAMMRGPAPIAIPT